MYLRCIRLLLDLRPCQVPTRTTVPPLFNRSDLPRKLVQLSKKHFILWAPRRHSVKTVCYVPQHHIKRARDRAYYIVWHCTCKFTHLFNPKDTHQGWTEHITLSVDVTVHVWVWSIYQTAIHPECPLPETLDTHQGWTEHITLSVDVTVHVWVWSIYQTAIHPECPLPETLDTHQRWTEHITLSVDVSDCACLCVIHIPDCHPSRVSPAWDAGHVSKMNWTHYIVCRCEWLCMSVCDPYMFYSVRSIIINYLLKRISIQHLIDHISSQANKTPLNVCSSD